MISHILHPINQSAPCLKKRHTIGLLYLWHTSTDFDIFRQKCCRQSKQSKDALLRHLKQLVLLHYLAKRETRNVHFSLKCCITALPEFNQSLIGFFNLFDSRLILTLLHDSLNLVINAFSSGLLWGVVQEKGSREHCSSWTVLHAQSTGALSSGLPLSQSNAEALDRWRGKTKHRLISYFLRNTSAKKFTSSDRVASQRWDVFWDIAHIYVFTGTWYTLPAFTEPCSRPWIR